MRPSTGRHLSRTEGNRLLSPLRPRSAGLWVRVNPGETDNAYLAARARLLTRAPIECELPRRIAAGRHSIVDWPSRATAHRHRAAVDRDDARRAKEGDDVSDLSGRYQAAGADARRQAGRGLVLGDTLVRCHTATIAGVRTVSGVAGWTTGTLTPRGPDSSARVFVMAATATLRTDLRSTLSDVLRVRRC